MNEEKVFLEELMKRLLEVSKGYERSRKKEICQNYKHITDKGEAVASKSELVIANLLYAYGIQYEYEKEINVNGVVYKPDFTVGRSNGTMLLWEHVGLMDDPEYARKFEQKMMQYQNAGYTQSKNLIVTYDENQSFSASEVRRMIELYQLT